LVPMSFRAQMRIQRNKQFLISEKQLFPFSLKGYSCFGLTEL